MIDLRYSLFDEWAVHARPTVCCCAVDHLAMRMQSKEFDALKSGDAAGFLSEGHEQCQCRCEPYCLILPVSGSPFSMSRSSVRANTSDPQP